MLRVGSLFSGIGGLELGLEYAGLGPVLWQVEESEFCRSILAKHWPNANRSVTDVRAVDYRMDRVDLICGGFPCQDLSAAGRRVGLSGARSGLWYEFARIVGDLRPRVVVAENVASGARRWLCPVRHGLRELGYRTRALGIRADDLGAPHRRARIFVVAYADGVELRQQPRGIGGANWAEAALFRGGSTTVADPYGLGHARAGRQEPSGEALQRPKPKELGDAQPDVGRGARGISARMDRWPAKRGEAQFDWEPPRTAIGVANRPARLRALGNAVVPQCAEIVGRVIRAQIEQLSVPAAP